MERPTWIESTDRSGDYKYMQTPFCTYEVRRSGKAKFKALVHGVWMHGLLTEYVAQTICEQDYDARVAKIALANGYIHLQPGQVVVDARWVAPAIEDFCATCEGPVNGCIECGLKPISDRVMAVRDAGMGEIENALKRAHMEARDE